MASLFDMLVPKSQQLKRTMFEVLKDKYPPHDQIIERVSSALVTDGDIQAFYKMVTDIYEVAYMKSVADHAEQLRRAGMVAKVVPGS